MDGLRGVPPGADGGATATARSATSWNGPAGVGGSVAGSQTSGGSATMASTRRSSTTEPGVKVSAQPAQSSAASGEREASRRGGERHGHHCASTPRMGRMGSPVTGLFWL